MTSEKGVGRKGRTSTRLAPGGFAQTTLPRRAAAVYAATAGKENVQPKGRGTSSGKAGTAVTPTPGDTPSKVDAGLGASAPRLYRREAPRAARPACTPGPLSPSDAHSPPRLPENHLTRPKSTQQRSGAPRDGQPRREAKPARRRRRPAAPGNARQRPAETPRNAQQRPAAPKGRQARHTAEPAGRRQRPETPGNACQRPAATPSSAQQRPAAQRSAPQRKGGSEATPCGPNSASPASPTQQRPPSTGNPPVSGGKPPPTATPAGLRHSRWDGLRRGGSAAALAERVRGGRPGGCVGQGTAQNHRAILSRPGGVRDSFRRPSQSQPFAELRDFSLTWRQGWSKSRWSGPSPGDASQLQNSKRKRPPSGGVLIPARPSRGGPCLLFRWDGGPSRRQRRVRQRANACGTRRQHGTLLATDDKFSVRGRFGRGRCHASSQIVSQSRYLRLTALTLALNMLRVTASRHLPTRSRLSHLSIVAVSTAAELIPSLLSSSSPFTSVRRSYVDDFSHPCQAAVCLVEKYVAPVLR